MKQKRKVKSLLSLKKDKKEVFIMNLLLILSVTLCIGSALLITTSVGATADNNNGCQGGICSYTGLDDNSEVVYKMNFVDPEKLDRTVNSMYIKNSNFYITSGQVIVNPATPDGKDIDRSVNKVGTGLYSHILGGSGNEVNSNNITLIAGENNKISSGNDNATILGGKDNNFSGGKNRGTPVISLGGENNKAEKDHDGVALIGGEGNEIGEAVSNTFILGGKNNKVSDTENVIVGGSDVTISGTKNIFVYSNSGNFEPKTDNAFYLNVIGGVGINGTGTAGGISAENAVSIGTININEDCDVDNLGVVGSYSGCLVGCTTKGKDNGNKWELLDRGSGCAETCSNSAKCIVGNNITGTIVPANNYNAQCTEGYVDTENAHLCPSVSGYISQYRNVIFETNLLDSDDPCPYEQENLCVYQCNQGFHLTGDVVSGTIKCYKDCELPWTDANGNKIEIKHNQQVFAYNTGNVSCSNDIYLFPFSTELNNKGTPALSPSGRSIGNKIINGVTYKNRATNGYSPETCGNYDHQKTLICNNGVLEMMDKNGKPIANTSGLAATYKYSSCNLYSYSCDTSIYNLTQQKIQDEKMDQPKDSNRAVADRGSLQGIRGIYSLCTDFSANGESCAKGQYHYKFIKCQNGYDLMDGKCMKRCYLQGNKCDVNKDGVFNISDNTRYVTNCKNDPSSPIECDLNGDGKYDNADSVLFQSCSASVALSGVYAHGTVTTGYKAASATCTGTCQAAGLRCNDGDWVSTTNGNKVTDYPYNNCTLHPKTCGDQYNVSHADYLEWSGTSIYESCDSYNPNGKFACVRNNTRYKLIGCKTGFHTEDKKHCEKNRGTADCPDKPNNSHWVWQGGTVTDYPGFNIFGGISLEAGKYLKWWNGAWNATTTNGWGTEKYPSNACDRECDGGYHKSGDSCTSNICTGDEPKDNVNTGGRHPGGNGNKTWKYITGATQTGLSACEWTCKDGYTRAKDTNGNRLNECIEKECGDGLPISMNGVLTGKSTYTGADDNRKWTYNSGTLGACQWKCRNGREKSGNGCILTVKASCGNPAEHFECEEGTPTNQQTGRDGNTIKGWTWNCMGTPGGNSQELCIECNTEQGYSRQNNTCVSKNICPAPIITKVEGTGVYFDLNGAVNPNTVLLYISSTGGTWTTDAGDIKSPRFIKSKVIKIGYVKLKTACSGGLGSADSNIEEFGNLPTMIIDKINHCELTYHFTGEDFISNKGYSTNVRVESSEDRENWYQIRKNYYSTGIKEYGHHLESGQRYFRYTTDGGWHYSQVSTYYMEKQRCCKTPKYFYDESCLDWKYNGLYSEDGSELILLSGWNLAECHNKPLFSNYCSYTINSMVYEDDLIPVGTWFSNEYNGYMYLDKNKSEELSEKIGSDKNEITVYVPGNNNKWNKLEMKTNTLNGYKIRYVSSLKNDYGSGTLED